MALTRHLVKSQVLLVASAHYSLHPIIAHIFQHCLLGTYLVSFLQANMHEHWKPKECAQTERVP